MVTIKNPSLAGERLTTQYGVFVFNSEGLVDVPEELAQKLLTINGFTLVEKPDDPPQENSVTLEGGVVWTKIDGGYIVYNDVIAFTVTGSGVDSDVIPPTNIVFNNGTLSLDANIDTANLHVLGVTPEDTIKIGENTYKWSDVDGDTSNGYELEYVAPPEPEPPVYTLDGGGNYVELPDGGYKLYDNTSSYSLVSGNFDVDRISIQDGQLVLSEGIDTANLHVLGVTPEDTIKIGENTYKWSDVDGDTSNGYELELVEKFSDLPNGGKYAIIQGKFVVTDGQETFTLIMGTLDIDTVGVKNGKLLIFPGVDINSIHVVGVAEGDTIQIGKDIYKWENTDLTTEGYELVLVPQSPWEKTESNIIYQGTSANYTIFGSAVVFDTVNNTPTNVSVIGGELKFDDAIDVNNLHVIGTEENSTIQIGNNWYKWVDLDNSPDNGLELQPLYEEDIDGFVYDFDGKQFTVEGGMSSSVTIDQLNEGVTFNADGKLTFSGDIVSSLDGIHIQGLESGSVVNVAGEDYTLLNADNDMANGYELVGGTNDAFNWKWSNRNRPANSQIWRHYINDTPDIKVQGVSARPNFDQQSSTLTLIGTEISSVANSTDTTIQLSGDIEGRLSAGALFTTKNGIVGGDATSYIYLDGILYVMYGSISGLSGKFEFTLANQHLNITSGNLDVNNAVVTGDAIATVSISNKNFSVRGNKLVKSAFSKRRAIRL